MLYKVTNLQKDPRGVEQSLYRTWTLNLLSDKEREMWEEYKLTPAFVGTTTEERAKMKRTMTAVKLQSFVNGKQLGVPRQDASTGTINFMWELKPGVSYVTEEQVQSLRAFEVKEIVQKLRLGQVSPDVHTEGFIVIEEYFGDTVPEETKPIEQETTNMDVSTDPAPSKFVCDVCGKEFDKPASLRGHKMSHKVNA